LDPDYEAKTDMSESDVRSTSEGLRKANADPNPFRQFDRWYRQALATDIQLPNAMTLATATLDGMPSARMVLLKDFDEDGFVFYTNYESQKGRELLENPQASLVFYWAQLDHQVRISGATTKVSRVESEEYFATRPRDSQLSAWVSSQSSVIQNRLELERRMQEIEEQYRNEQVPCPQYWGGYRLVPSVIEFWENRPGRLHDRLRYTRQGDQAWLIDRLQP
jgi:pyridoxamine 5'-phosphate oxidase